MAIKEQQGSLSAKDRLAQISHHFLSDEGVDHHAPRTVTASWGLLTPPHLARHLPWHMLGQALTACGLSTLVLDTIATPPTASWLLAAGTEGRLQLSISQGCGAAASLFADTISKNRAPDVCLQVAADHNDAMLHSCDFLILATGPDAPALRLAYGALKRLAAAYPRASLGVTMIDVPDEPTARRSYCAIAAAAQRFLCKEIASFGSISRTALRNHADVDSTTLEAKALREELGKIATLIATDTRTASPFSRGASL